MPKFNKGQVLTTNKLYKTEYRKIFKKEPKQKGGVVLDIYDDKKHEPIYFFTELDEEGNREGLAEKFVQLAV